MSEDTWIKAGIEVVNNIARLSCVTINEYSDWSTQIWHDSSEDCGSARLNIRVLQMGDGSYVVQASTNSLEDPKPIWTFIRICCMKEIIDLYKSAAEAGLEPGADRTVGLGVFRCCPKNNVKCSVKFRNFSIREGVDFDHNVDGHL